MDFKDIILITIIIIVIYALFGIDSWSVTHNNDCRDKFGEIICEDNNQEFISSERKFVNCVDEDRKLTNYYYIHEEIEECSKIRFFPFK